MTRVNLLENFEHNEARVERYAVPLDSGEPFLGRRTLRADLQGMLPLRILVAPEPHAFILHSLRIDEHEQMCAPMSAAVFSGISGAMIYLPRGRTLTLEIENVGMLRLALAWEIRWSLPFGREKWVRGWPWRRRRAPRERVVYPLRFTGMVICERIVT